MKDLTDLEFVIQNKIVLTVENLEDIFVTAIEGGINHWAIVIDEGDDWDKAMEDCKYNPNYFLWISLIAKYIVCDLKRPVKFEDTEDSNVKFELTYEKFDRGVTLYYQNQGDLKQVLDNGNFDAEEADILFQYAIFGDIIYG